MNPLTPFGSSILLVFLILAIAGAYIFLYANFLLISLASIILGLVILAILAIFG